MDLESAKKVPLNRITHSVRASQAVLQYGVGAMIDFPNQTLMTAAPEYGRSRLSKYMMSVLKKCFALIISDFPVDKMTLIVARVSRMPASRNGIFAPNADDFSQSAIGFPITKSQQHRKDSIAIRIWLSLCNARSADKISWSRVLSLHANVGTLMTSRG